MGNEPYSLDLAARIDADKQRDFVKWIGTLALCGGVTDTARDIFRDRGWDRALEAIDKARAHDVALRTKAAVAAGTVRDAVWAQPLAPVQVAAPFVKALQDHTLFSRAGARRVVATAGIAQDLTAPGVGFAWTGEGHVKPLSARSLAMAVLQPAKCAVLVVVTNELARLSDPPAVDFLRDELIINVTTQVDAAACDPSQAAIAGVKPASLTNGVTATTVGTNMADAVSAVLGALLTSRPQALRPTIVLSPAKVCKLAGSGLFPNLSVAGGEAFGVPVVVTPGAAGWIIAIDAGAVAYADDGAEFSISNEAAVQMDSAPDDPATAATVMVSFWQENLVGLKCERFVTWKAGAGCVQWAVSP